MKQYRRLRLLFSVLSIKSVSLLALMTVLIIISLALIGWVFNIPILKSANQQLTAMRIITIICFFMSAAAMAIVQQSTIIRWQIIIVRVFAFGIITVGLLTIVSYLVKLQTGQEWSLAQSALLSPFLSAATRMAIITAILFSIYGCVLFLLDARSRRAADVAHAILLPMAIMTYLVLVGYLFNVKAFYEWLHLGMALNTGIAFCALCIASLLSRPDTWLIKVFIGDKAGAVMARRLLPALLILPLVIGWLRLHGERSGIFSSEFGVALVAVVYTVCFLFLVWLTARSVNRTDQRRRNAEETLRENEQRLKHALESGDLGIWGLYTKTGQVWRSPRHDQIFGYETLLTEWSYQIFLDYVLPEDRTEVEHKFGRAISAGTEWSFECRIRRTDGAIRWIWAQGKPRISDKNEVVQLVGLVRDITDSKQMEEELRRAHDELELRVQERTAELLAVNKELLDQIVERKRTEKELEQYRQHLEELVENRTAALTAANRELESFSYSVSHDLRAPLRHMSGFAEMLQKRVGGDSDEKMRHYAEVISIAAKKMGILIDDLLAFSRIGRADIRMKIVDVNKLVEEVIQDLTDETTGRDIEWQIGELPDAYCDPSMLRLAFTNLISNAVKFTRPRSRAKIEIACTKDSNGEHLFFIKDNGVGFDMKYAEKLFGVFKRLHHDDEFEGTGIGLANVRRIISRHGGRTWAASVIDQGATFYFTLPTTEETEACRN